MDVDYPEWGRRAAQFLAESLPTVSDPPGWEHMFSTAYQIGCKGLVKLGFADETDWGATPKELPEQPKAFPRWDDICISVLWLAEQQGKLHYLLPDGSAPPPTVGKGFAVIMMGAPPPKPPNIAARFGLGPARGDPEVTQLLEQLGLISGGGWTEAAVFLLWRTSPRNWALDFVRDDRFLRAVENAVVCLPDEIAAEISALLVIKDEDICAHIDRVSQAISEHREKFGPKARLGSVPSKEEARRSIEFLRKSNLDWLFFRRWRIDDAWLSKEAAKSALEVFQDRLAISMRKSVLQRLHPAKPLFYK